MNLYKSICGWEVWDDGKQVRSFDSRADLLRFLRDVRNEDWADQVALSTEDLLQLLDGEASDE